MVGKAHPNLFEHHRGNEEWQASSESNFSSWAQGWGI